jgi:restriction system protein
MHFPSGAALDEYIKTIHSRSQQEVIDLVAEFLVQCGPFSSMDQIRLDRLLGAYKSDRPLYEKLKENTYYQRLARHWFSGEQTASPGGGITWVVDLLPDHPDLALQAMRAYWKAHLVHFSDGMIWCWGDAEQLIRAKFIGTPETYEDTINVLLREGPRTFECLVERLYDKMGYKTELTKPQKDGGRDVIAWRAEPGQQQRLLVECKLYTDPVKVHIPRQLLGVVSAEKVNKGVLATTARFTRGSRRFSEENPRVELLPGEQLIPLMNQHLGTNWPLRIDYLKAEAETQSARKAK